MPIYHAGFDMTDRTDLTQIELFEDKLKETLDRFNPALHNNNQQFLVIVNGKHCDEWRNHVFGDQFTTTRWYIWMKGIESGSDEYQKIIALASSGNQLVTSEQELKNRIEEDNSKKPIYLWMAQGRNSIAWMNQNKPSNNRRGGNNIDPKKILELFDSRIDETNPNERLDHGRELKQILFKNDIFDTNEGEIVSASSVIVYDSVSTTAGDGKHELLSTFDWLSLPFEWIPVIDNATPLYQAVPIVRELANSPSLDVGDKKFNSGYPTSWIKRPTGAVQAHGVADSHECTSCARNKDPICPPISSGIFNDATWPIQPTKGANPNYIVIAAHKHYCHKEKKMALVLNPASPVYSSDMPHILNHSWNRAHQSSFSPVLFFHTPVVQTSDVNHRHSLIMALEIAKGIPPASGYFLIGHSHLTADSDAPLLPQRIVSNSRIVPTVHRQTRDQWTGTFIIHHNKRT